MDSDVGSFRVHLQSLKDFALRLQEQVYVLEQPTTVVGSLGQAPSLPLGAFAEAYSLSDNHNDAAQQMAMVLQKVGRSLDFARSVTELVAQRYEALNAGGAQNIGSVGAAISPAPPLPVPPITGTAAPPVGSLAPPGPARATVPVPPPDGTVYYYNGSQATPVNAEQA
jgi:hypothetical protein